MPGSIDEIKRKLLEGYVRTSPLMDMMYRADEAGAGNIGSAIGGAGDSLGKFLKGRGRPLPSRGPDDLQRQRGQMNELEYRKYLADQGRQGQQMADQPIAAPSPK